MRMPLSSLFDEDRYLAQYPAVRDAVQAGNFASAEEHWWRIGRYEQYEPMYAAGSTFGQDVTAVVVVKTGTALKQLCRTVESLARQTLMSSVFYVVDHDLAAEPLSYLFERASRDSHSVIVGSSPTLSKQALATALSCAGSKFVAYVECGVLLLPGALDELIQPLRSSSDVYSSLAAWIREEREEDVHYPEGGPASIEEESLLPPFFVMRASFLSSIPWMNYPALSPVQLYRIATASRRTEIIRKPLAMRPVVDAPRRTLPCGPWFDETRYRADNYDVDASIVSGFMRSAEDHWWRHGRAEARVPRFVEAPLGNDRPTLTLLSRIHSTEDMRSAVECLLHVDSPDVHLTILEDGLSNDAAKELWLLCAGNPRVRLVSTLGCGGGTLSHALRRWIHGRWVVSVPFGIELDPAALRDLCRRCEDTSDVDKIPVTFSTASRTFLTRCTVTESCEDPSNITWSDLEDEWEISEQQSDEIINLGVVAREIEVDCRSVSRTSSGNTTLPQRWSPPWNEMPIFESVEVLDFFVSPETNLTDHSSGFVPFVFVVRTRAGEILAAHMKLHLSEPLEGLIFADPRAFPDGGRAVNSVGSSLLARRTKYTTIPRLDSLFVSRPDRNLRFFRIREDDLQRALSAQYDPEKEIPRAREQFRKKPAVAFTMLSPNYAGGGTAIALRFCEWLTELGVDVTVYALTAALSKLRPKVRSVVINTRQELASQITEPVVVVFSAFHLEPLLRYRVGDKIIVQLRQAVEAAHHGGDLDSLFLDKPFIRLSERAPVIPVHVGPHLQEHYARLNGQHGELIINGIDTNVFYRRPYREHLNAAFTILSTGSPHYALKGQHYLAAALNRFAASRPEQQIRWIIASGADDTTDVSHLKQAENLLIEYRRGLAPTEVADVMRLSDVTVSSSLYEGFGLPAIEAMACGVPVITSHSYGLDYILEHESNCLVVPAGSVEELLSGLERIYSDEDLRRRLSQEGPRTARTFGLLPQFSQFTSAFERILDYRFDPRLVEEMQTRLSDRVKLPARIRKKRSRTGDPLVSVVVPAFNRESLLGETLDSVLGQTCPDWEVVVVDDGSSDDTVQVAREYARRDDRIRVVCHDRNQGISAALNTGIAESRGRFFSWLSSDDLFHHDKLRIQLEEFSKLPSNYGLVYSSFDERLEEKRRFNRLPLHQALEPDFELTQFLKFDYIHGCTTMIPLSILREVGGFCPSFRFAQDTEMWERIAAAGYCFHYTPHKLMLNRAHPLQSSANNIIKCRFDHLISMRFYLSRFSFLEVFRSVDVYRKEQRERLVKHIVSRFDHEQSLIHHEVLGRAFIEWLRVGLRATASGIQHHIISGIRDGLSNLAAHIPAVSRVIKELSHVLQSPLREGPTIIDLRMGSRSPVIVENGHVEAIEDLFKWTCKVLLDRNASRFSEQLGVAAKIDKHSEMHHWVAHSAISYLAEWPEGGLEFLRPYSGIDCVPKNDAEAEDLFIKIVLPSVTAELMALGCSSGRRWGDNELERAAQHAAPKERTIAIEVMSSVSLSPRMSRFCRALRISEVSGLQRGSSSFMAV